MHSGRIPNYKNSHGENFQTRCAAEPPACVQNAMLTKDKKPFTYTPGGLDLSQIKTPSMARRLNKQQRSLEEEEHSYHNGSYNGVGAYNTPNQSSCGPPAPPPPPPVAPPPPPLIINAPPSRSPKPPEGERPEIIIPENPIGMLRKTNSPYHWESEQAERQRDGLVPKFVEKSSTPSPVQPQLRSAPPTQYTQNLTTPQQFSQDPPQSYHYNQQPSQPINQFSHQSPQPNNFTPPAQQYNNQSPYLQNSIQHSPQPYYQQSPQPSYLQKQTSQQSPQQISPASQNSYQVYSPASQNSATEESPIWKPEPKYPSPYQSHSTTPKSPLIQSNNLKSVTSTPTRDTLQRQDSQFNKSPAPYSSLSGNASPYQQISPPVLSQSSISPNSSSSIPSSPWRQSVATNSPYNQDTFSPPLKDNRFSPAVSSFRNSPAAQDISASPVNNIQQQHQNKYGLNYKEPQPEEPPQYIYNNLIHPESSQTNGQSQIQNYSNVAPWRNPQHVRQEPQSVPENRSNPEEMRFQSHMTIPVTPRKQMNSEPPLSRKSPQKEVVFVTQEPVYYKPLDSPKEVPPWVKAKSEKEKTPPPVWCTRPLENRKSIPRDATSQDKESIIQPPWIQKSPDLSKSVNKEQTSPVSPQNTQNVPWSQKPSENRKSLPRDISGQPKLNTANRILSEREDSQVRIIPIQMEVSSKEVQRNITQNSRPNENSNPNKLRIIIDMKNQPAGTEKQYDQSQYNEHQYNPSQYSQPQYNPNQYNQAQYQQPQNNHTQYVDPPYSQPQQRISRVSNPHMVRLDNSTAQQQSSQPKTRIIPIQIEQSPGISAPKSNIIGGRN